MFQLLCRHIATDNPLAFNLLHFLLVQWQDKPRFPATRLPLCRQHPAKAASDFSVLLNYRMKAKLGE